MNVLKSIFKFILYFVLFVCVGHLLCHIWFLISGPYGLWYDDMDNRKHIDRDNYVVSTTDIGESIVTNKTINSVFPYHISDFGGTMTTSSGLYTDDIHYWYRCGLCHPTIFYYKFGLFKEKTDALKLNESKEFSKNMWESGGYTISTPSSVIAEGTDIYDRLTRLDKTEIQGGNIFDLMLECEDYDATYLLSNSDGDWCLVNDRISESSQLDYTVELSDIAFRYYNYGRMLDMPATIWLDKETDVYRTKGGSSSFTLAYPDIPNSNEYVYRLNSAEIVSNIDNLGTYRIDLIYGHDNCTILGIIFTLTKTMA